MNRQIRQVGYVIILLFLLLFVQVNNVQIVMANKLNEDPRNGRKITRVFGAARGIIQTADGTIIAKSVPSNDEFNYLRTYPSGGLYSNVTGYFSYAYGAEGVEKQYNEDLAGRVKTAQQFQDLLKDREVVNNVTLSIKNVIQTTARDQLGDKHGAIVALNPKTGAVLSMYSNPNYDPNLLASHEFKQVTADRNKLDKARDKPMLARTYRENYFPGSTFKVVLDGTVREWRPDLANVTYPSSSVIQLQRGGHPFHNFNGATCGGNITELLRRSCNTGFIAIGRDLGKETYVKGGEAFGFNSTPPIDLPAAAKSRIPTLKYLNANSADYIGYNSIGQDAVLATPLQMALVAGAIANKGSIMEPHVMKEIRDNNNQVVKSAQPKEWRRAISPDAAEQVKQDMIGVVERGSGYAAKVKGLTIAGKTGTATTQVNAEDGKTKLYDATHAWFICFAPAEDPQVAVAVLLEYQPMQDEATGGAVAAPIAREVLMAALGAQDEEQKQQQ